MDFSFIPLQQQLSQEALVSPSKSESQLFINNNKTNKINSSQNDDLMKKNPIEVMALRRISTRKRRTKVDLVGFSSLPEQVHRKSLKKGFEFTLLVVGDSGLGKSTLVNSLFMTDLYSEKNIDTKIGKTMSIKSRTAELEEKGVRLKLTVVDTPGFGDAINSQKCWKAIEDYIDNQFNSFYIHESGYGIDRKKLQDTRVHCCLYFIPSYVRGLRPIDIETMRSLQTKVNIVPVISKADSLTKKELEILKQNVLNDIQKHKVKIYEFPVCDSDDDESFKKIDEEIKSAIPFGVIGSNTTIECGNKRVRGRVYPWGIVDIESDASCDFNKLRTFLCSSHMQDLKDLTHDIHYENYRTEYIKSQKSNVIYKSENFPTKKSNQIPIEDTDKLLKEKEIELRKMQDLIEKMRTNMNLDQTNDYQNNIEVTKSGTNNFISFDQNGVRINQVINNGYSNTKKDFIAPSNQALSRISSNKNNSNSYFYYEPNSKKNRQLSSETNNHHNNCLSYLVNSTSI